MHVALWRRSHTLVAVAAVAALCLPTVAPAQAQPQNCPVKYDQLVQVLRQSVKASGGPDNGGMPVNEWAAVTDRLGNVCAVAYSGAKATDQWLGSRPIAVEKAKCFLSF